MDNRGQTAGRVALGVALNDAAVQASLVAN